MRDGLLEPRRDSLHHHESLFGYEAVYFVAQAHVEAAVPQPTDADVDFAVVDALECKGEIHTFDCGNNLAPTLRPRPLIESARVGCQRDPVTSAPLVYADNISNLAM